MSLTLIALGYSPWSEKARWALDHHKLTYSEVEHVPMLGAPWLRLRTGRLIGKVTVPVLLDGREAIFDSFRIAQHVESSGQGAALIPADRHDAIAGWVRSSEAVLEAGRARVVERTLADRGALREALPPMFPEAARPAFEVVARMGAHYLAVKYGTRGASGAAHLDTMRAQLNRLADAIDGPGTYLLGQLTLADIAMAVALQMVKPVADEYIRIGPATRAVWTEPELSGEFEGLLRWRDWLYAEHRRRGSRVAGHPVRAAGLPRTPT